MNCSVFFRVRSLQLLQVAVRSSAQQVLLRVADGLRGEGPPLSGFPPAPRDEGGHASYAEATDPEVVLYRNPLPSVMVARAPSREAFYKSTRYASWREASVTEAVG